MIKAIDIRNFQSHKHTRLELDPGVNVVVGLSDAGKSAIIRALRWLIINRPQGESFRSRWGGITSVSMETDATTVIRRRSNKDNDYAITKEGSSDFLILKAMGTEVPQEVQLALNINEINMQLQLDHPFLLDSSPGEVAQHFNKVAQLDIIDTSIQTVQKWTREIEQDIKSRQQQLANAQEEIKQYYYLDELEGKIVVLEKMDVDLTRLVVRETKIMNSLESIRETEGEIRLYEKTIQIETLVNLTLSLLKDKEEKVETKYNIQGVIDLIRINERAIERRNELIKIESLVHNTIKLTEQREKVEKKKNDLDALLYTISVTDNELKNKTSNLKKTEERFHSIFPEVCPLCGQEVKK